MKNILVVVGSGRKNGNTEQLADSFIKGAEEAGHHVKKVFLGNKTINGCIGCNACRYGKPCIQKDDFNELIPDIKSCDLLVFASPLFFWTISAKIKAFIVAKTSAIWISSGSILRTDVPIKPSHKIPLLSNVLRMIDTSCYF